MTPLLGPSSHNRWWPARSPSNRVPRKDEIQAPAELRKGISDVGIKCLPIFAEIRWIVPSARECFSRSFDYFEVADAGAPETKLKSPQVSDVMQFHAVKLIA